MVDIFVFVHYSFGADPTRRNPTLDLTSIPTLTTYQLYDDKYGAVGVAGILACGVEISRNGFLTPVRQDGPVILKRF